LLKPRSGSRSAKCASRFAVRTSVVRFGSDVDRVGAMVPTRFWARRRVCSRGERGKLERWVIELSVKSIASWPCFVH
jgi:hypothetical protein